MLQLKEEERISINELCQEVLSLIKKRYPKWGFEINGKVWFLISLSIKFVIS
jgi:hypothetical protein